MAVDFKDLAEVSWEDEKIFENDIEYVLKENEEESEKELEESNRKKYCFNRRFLRAFEK